MVRRRKQEVKLSLIIKWFFQLLVIKNSMLCAIGCFDEERSALLQLQPFFNFGDNTTSSSDCCLRESDNLYKVVECNPTGRVIGLRLFGGFKEGGREWYLNASLFLPFKHLQFLDLSDNQIAGCIHDEGFHKLSTLTNFTRLNLDGNYFNNSILPSISSLPFLQYLSLSENRLKGIVDLGEFHPFNHLILLNLDGNEIDEILFPRTELHLEGLYLAGNNLNNTFLSSLVGLPWLRQLLLDGNKLKGEIDLSGISNSLKNLEILALGYNQINRLMEKRGMGVGFGKVKYLDLSNVSIDDENTLLQSIGLFPSLTSLAMSHNNFSGMVVDSIQTAVPQHNSSIYVGELYMESSSIDISLLQKLVAFTTLQNLTMYHCKLNELIDHMKYLKSLKMMETSVDTSVVQSIGFLTSLQVLSVERSIEAAPPHFLKDLCGLKNLEELDFSGNNMEEEFPSCFTNFRFLRYLDISNNQVSLNLSFIPQSIETLSLAKGGFRNLNSIKPFYNHSKFKIFFLKGLCGRKNLHLLDLSGNDMKDELPACFRNLTSLQWLDISFNQISGNISSIPQSIQTLFLANNQFEIPSSLEPFYNHSKLQVFIADNNKIHADTESDWNLIPKFQLTSLSMSCWGEDVFTFPKYLHHQHALEYVDLSDNNLQGDFPNWLLDNNTNLHTLVLANNSLTGSFRVPTHSHLNLSILDISHNLMQGKIPIEMGSYLPSLWNLNISMNNLSGSIPSSIGDMKLLKRLDLSENHLSGSIPCSLWNSSTLYGLYLSNNRLTGEIPKLMGEMSNLKDLVLSRNRLEGRIPLWLCELEMLQVLDIAENNISGSLPSCFSPPRIEQIHLAKNKLQGEINLALYNSTSLITLDLGYNRLGGEIPNWINRLTDLKYLILTNNKLEGEVPIQLCQLRSLRLIDLSHNNLSGQIPPCLDITALHFAADYPIPKPESSAPGPPPSFSVGPKESLQFTTKNISYTYQGSPLVHISGIDLSCNKLSGKIPPQIGNLTRIQTMNLSHNNLIGPIPSTFSHLGQIESLDLSHNHLNGRIPPELVELNFLSVFIVAYNNLSGRTPELKAQFGTFGESSYIGNPLLCGPPLRVNCSSHPGNPEVTSVEEEDTLIDMVEFYISFAVGYTTVVLTFVTVLVVNPYWRRRWFYLVETWRMSFYYFIIDHLPRRF